MRLKISKLFITVLISALLTGVIYKVIEACSFGEWDDCDLANYSFFDPNIINRPDETPLFVTCHSTYQNNNYGRLDILNAREWEIYLEHKLDSNDIRNIFGLRKEYNDTIFNFLNEKSPAPRLAWMNELALKLKALNNKQVTGYFQFSRKIEGIMSRHSYWDYENKRGDTAYYISAIAEAKEEIKRTSSSFLKARYAFQVQRVLFYLNRYKECAKWYTENVKLLKPGGSIRFRSLSFYAGCLYHQKNYAQSNYLFSLIYDKFPEMKLEAFTSFHPWEDADWNSTLKLAENTHEKEVLWQLFGVYADPLKGMKEIYALNPKSELIDLLLTRAVNICEKEQLPNTLYENENYSEEVQPQEVISERRIFDSSVSFAAFDRDSAKNELSLFVKEVADKNNTHNPGLWLNAYAYLSWMNKKYAVAGSYISQLKKRQEIDDFNKSQLAITDVLIQFGEIDKLTLQTEQQLFVLFSEMLNKNSNQKSEEVYKYISRQLAERYSSLGKKIMAELCSENGSGYYHEESDYDEMLSFMRKTNHTPLENFLLERYRVKPRNIIEYKAIKELLAYRFDGAIKWFEQDSTSGSAQLYGNPFTIHITDCHDCDHAAPQKTKYSKYTFTLKLKELLTAAESAKDKNEKAQNYFLLANGLYNMTYYGNARMVSEHNIYSDYYGFDQNGYSNGGCEKAMEYYQKALDYSTKKEFKAKCAWMCAKCELNNWYVTSEYSEGKLVFVEGDYFKLMKEKFSNTKYYAEVIEACGYFCSYTGGGSKCIRNTY